MDYRGIQQRTFKCNTCGAEVDAPKKKGRTNPGHTKSMYCYVCRMITNHTQVDEYRKDEPMNELQIFSNPRFGEVRTLEEDGKVLFCGSDVAKALGYKSPKDAISAHCKGAVKRRTLTAGGAQEMNFIPEGDIYRLAAKSELPGAEQFEGWIFDTVIPSVRKHGGYMAGQESMSGEELLAKALMYANNLAEERQRKIEEMAPKALFADSVAASETSILVGELAKILKQNGVDIGQNRFFDWLRSNGYLIRRSGTDYNMPTQRSMEMGLFSIKETAVTHSDGHVTIGKTPKVTGKGQQYFIDLFLGQKEARQPG